jgi:hypothetical protein
LQAERCIAEKNEPFQKLLKIKSEIKNDRSETFTLETVSTPTEARGRHTVRRATFGAELQQLYGSAAIDL